MMLVPFERGQAMTHPLKKILDGVMNRAGFMPCRIAPGPLTPPVPLKKSGGTNGRRTAQAPSQKKDRR